LMWEALRTLLVGSVTFLTSEAAVAADAGFPIPIGWFSSAVMGTSESLPPAPFTHVVKYWNNNPPENSTAAVLRYLDQAQDRGVTVVLELPRRWVAATGGCGNSSGGGHHRGDPGGRLCGLVQIHKMVTAVCTHPAIGGWYMADEPDRRTAWIAPAALAKVAATVRAAEAGAGVPHLPIQAVFCRLQLAGNASHARAYNRSVDVYMFDYYPCRCSSPGWHARCNVQRNLFSGPDFAAFPAEIRAVWQSVAPQFRDFWMVLQGSIIASAADHGHFCNATKCWSAGWRECALPEVRYQLYAALLAGARGLMFYRLGIGGWEDPGLSAGAELNRTWVHDTLLPALAEIRPHVRAIAGGSIVTPAGVPLPSTNVSEEIVRPLRPLWRPFRLIFTYSCM
jgi:hypothetical protein